MNKLENIKPVEINEELVEELTHLLSRAKKGELTGLYTLSYWDDGAVNHGWHFAKQTEHMRVLGNAYHALRHLNESIAVHYGDTLFEVKV